MVAGAAAVVLVLAGCGAEGDGSSGTEVSDGTEVRDGEQVPDVVPALGEAQTTEHTLMVDGRERTYSVYAPASLPAEGPVPVVLFLHGGLGSGEQLGETAHVAEHAEDASYLAVLPDGATNDEGRFRTWNGGRCCGPAMNADVDDVAFIAALLDEVEAEWDVDADRVYAAGHSNGAIMANRLACDLPGTFAAIGAVAGSLETPCEDGQPTNVLYIHGDADTNHPLEGGIGRDGISGTDFTSVADSLDRWTEIGACGADPEVTEEGAITTSVWTGCDDGVDVELQVIAGAAHPWPGGESSPLPMVGEVSQELDATAAVWTFFEQHPRG
jgi:polyhydroxybutyrate depolymerase